jgi:hypothetical protein
MRMSRSSLLHLRIPFSLFLSPVFFFALSELRNSYVSFASAGLLFFILHILIYPGSQAYNSFYDRDEDSIGGLLSPPRVEGDLIFWAWAFTLSGLLALFFMGWESFVLGVVYVCFSKLYSHPRSRWKARPFLSSFIVSFSQGSLVFILVCRGLAPLEPLSSRQLFASLLSTLIILSGYPLSQIFQHPEDARRGDWTLSRYLGIRGTLIFSVLSFLLLQLGFLGLYSSDLRHFFLLQICLLPGLLQFLYILKSFFDSSRIPDQPAITRLQLWTSLGFMLFFCLLIGRMI